MADIGKAQPRTGKHRLTANDIAWVARIVVLILSILLIVFISYDTLKGIDFLESVAYMNFQFLVCMVFLADFILEFYISDDKRSYMKRHWIFLVVSIPYLNIINLFNIQVDHQALYFIRFVPLMRGAYAMAYVVAFFSSNKAVSLLSQYIVILISAVYFISLIFYQQEYGINPQVNSFWDAVYWACLDATTVGSEIIPATLAGRVCAIIISVLGVMMFPVFTVFVTTYLNDVRKKNEARQEQLKAEREAKLQAENNSSESKPFL